MKKDETIIENGSLVKHKLTGAIGIVIDNEALVNDGRYRMSIYYSAEEVDVSHLAGKTLFNYSGKTCFREYNYPEEVEVIINEES